MKKLACILTVIIILFNFAKVSAGEVFVACPPGKLPDCSCLNEHIGTIVDTVTQPPESIGNHSIVEYSGHPQTVYQATYKIFGSNKPSIALLCIPRNLRKPRCCSAYFSSHKDISGGIKCEAGETLRVLWRNYLPAAKTAHTGKILVTKTILQSYSNHKNTKNSL